jgi:hypothetical protein
VEELLSTYSALGYNMSLTSFPAISLGFFSLEIWDPSLTSTVKVSDTIYPEWKKRYSGK